jgi:hypothetical protein
VTDKPSEATKYHTRLLKAALAVEESRAYWAARRTKPVPTPDAAFSEYWFGAKSLPWLRRLLADMRERYEAYPSAIRVLSAWEHMSAAMRTTICHWHLQLADPLYRKFTGHFLPDREHGGFSSITRSVVARWIEEVCPDRWQTTTRNQFGRKLLYSAADSGLLKADGNDWAFATPRIDDASLTYFMYLLREIDFKGTLTNNPYLRSVEVDAATLAGRLQASPDVKLYRQSDLIDFTWKHDSLIDWAMSCGIAIESVKGEVA